MRNTKLQNPNTKEAPIFKHQSEVVSCLAGTMQLMRERTRPVCCRCRPDNDFVSSDFLTPNGVENWNERSIRRDAECRTPEARAPQFQMNRSGLAAPDGLMVLSEDPISQAANHHPYSFAHLDLGLWSLVFLK